ncbi:glycosyltransferase [uncultured Kriegella sp.]|uniref:glycosyltransferase n=1 Tax=uncultured Kriegella sp. TaxID=1798910 RepID=UPI0030DA7077|tara:strand:+ start:38968 stop:39678 length:711 start_codon:yes stop_codon:yes gene_type:complete
MISIIIPAHNEYDNLRPLLFELAPATTLDGVEVIVSLSSCSTDDSENIEVGEHIRFWRSSGTGRAIQMNEAADLAKGNILVFLHADVTPPKSFLSDIENTLKAGYDAGFFSYRFDNENVFLKINASFTAKDGIFTGGGDQCLFIRKSVFEKLEGFDKHQIVMEDFEFFERMKKNNVRYKIIKNDLVVSARKYQNNSYMRVNLSNLLLVILFKLGYPANKLKTLHNRLIRSPYQSGS